MMWMPAMSIAIASTTAGTPRAAPKNRSMERLRACSSRSPSRSRVGRPGARVAGLLHRGDERFEPDRAQRDQRCFGREVHVGGLDALDLAERALDAAHAGGARHAGDVERGGSCLVPCG